MKILFLDIDGVLNNRRFYGNRQAPLSEAPISILQSIIDPVNMRELETLFKRIPDLKIVITSSWGSKYLLEHFQELFKSYGEVIAITSRPLGSKKKDQILGFLKDQIKQNIILEKFAIVDDENIFPLGIEYSSLKKNHVKTSFDLGWNSETTKELISLLL